MCSLGGNVDTRELGVRRNGRGRALEERPDVHDVPWATFSPQVVTQVAGQVLDRVVSQTVAPIPAQVLASAYWTVTARWTEITPESRDERPRMVTSAVPASEKRTVAVWVNVRGSSVQTSPCVMMS